MSALRAGHVSNLPTCRSSPLKFALHTQDLLSYDLWAYWSLCCRRKPNWAGQELPQKVSPPAHTLKQTMSLQIYLTSQPQKDGAILAVSPVAGMKLMRQRAGAIPTLLWFHRGQCLQAQESTLHLTLQVQSAL